MLSIYEAGSVRLCDGVSRREVLRAGALGLGGASWPAWRQALGAPGGQPGRTTGRARACIVLFLMGGPPQHSTWDPKPAAPPEVRGEFPPIATSVPGVQFCELLPRMARLAHKLAVLRAVVTNDNAHSSSGYQMLTGVPHQPLNVENANPGFPNNWPTLGSVVQHLHRGPRVFPPAVRLPMHIFNTDQSVWPGQDAGFLGHAADPWLLRCEPNTPNFQVPHFRLEADVSLGRLDQRRTLLRQLDRQLSALEQSGSLETFGQLQRQAFDLLSAPTARSACNLELEPAAVRDRYGRTQFGQSVLLARRLVEAGVSLVHVNWFRGPDEPPDNPCWDSHTNETERLRTVLVPPLDQAFSALLEDLEQRGRLEETLVICTAEFGRTPRFNHRGGRDHWGHVFPTVLAGGGIRGGVVHGASDAQGAYPKDGPVSPADLTATIFHCLGIPPETEIHDPLDRALPISRGEVIRPIVSTT